MKFHKFYSVLIKHKDTLIETIIFAPSPKEAAKQACELEGCPRSSVISTKEWVKPVNGWVPAKYRNEANNT